MWELIDNEHTYRMKTPRGWIVKTIHENYIRYEPNNGSNIYNITSSICFVPDPGHLWELKG